MCLPLIALVNKKPGEELVLSHGDYCLPNIFGIQDLVTGYIDLGRAGIADKFLLYLMNWYKSKLGENTILYLN